MLNSGKKWSNYGVQKMLWMAAEGATHRVIARQLCRTRKAVSCKAARVRKAMVPATFQSFARLWVGAW